MDGGDWGGLLLLVSNTCMIAVLNKVGLAGISAHGHSVGLGRFLGFIFY